MRAAVWIVCGFAALWAVVLIMGLGLPTWWIAAPILVSVGLVSALLVLSARARKSGVGAARSPADQRRAWRAVGLWAAIEFVALVVASNLLIHWGMSRAITPVAVIIVGVHFLGMARQIPAPIYYGTGFGMIALGGLGLVLPWPISLAVAAGGAAVVLWGTAIALIRRQIH